MAICVLICLRVSTGATQIRFFVVMKLQSECWLSCRIHQAKQESVEKMKDANEASLESVCRRKTRKFDRAVNTTNGGTNPSNRLDSRGTVRVQVMLIAQGEINSKPGNIIRSIRISEAKVSEVLQVIEEALF